MLDYYRQLAAREKAEKEKKRYNRRRSYLHLSVSWASSHEKLALKSHILSRLSCAAGKLRECFFFSGWYYLHLICEIDVT